ncbi:hypothetical protein V5799_023781 [Amblyomma americanum]|uniref:RING-CH-type domain-containing protein n=1 Tax=Amblyomma americanum TaxID=6943 RepID=A0AAQ4FI22_AMBAM
MSAPICRICHDEGHEPLLSMCKCSGSIGLVHVPCLERWLNTRDSDDCELCNHRFPTTAVQYSSVVLFFQWFFQSGKHQTTPNQSSSEAEPSSSYTPYGHLLSATSSVENPPETGVVVTQDASLPPLNPEVLWTRTKSLEDQQAATSSRRNPRRDSNERTHLSNLSRRRRTRAAAVDVQVLGQHGPCARVLSGTLVEHPPQRRLRALPPPLPDHSRSVQLSCHLLPLVPAKREEYTVGGVWKPDVLHDYGAVGSAVLLLLNARSVDASAWGPRLDNRPHGNYIRPGLHNGVICDSSLFLLVVPVLDIAKSKAKASGGAFYRQSWS